MLQTLRRTYGDPVQFVFRSYPLANHRCATISAKAAYAAFLQGKFWEMRVLLFENQKEMNRYSIIMRMPPLPGCRLTSAPSGRRSPYFSYTNG